MEKDTEDRVRIFTLYCVRLALKKGFSRWNYVVLFLMLSAGCWLGKQLTSAAHPLESRVVSVDPILIQTNYGNNRGLKVVTKSLYNEYCHRDEAFTLYPKHADGSYLLDGTGGIVRYPLNASVSGVFFATVDDVNTYSYTTLYLNVPAIVPAGVYDYVEHEEYSCSWALDYVFRFSPTQPKPVGIVLESQ